MSKIFKLCYIIFNKFSGKSGEVNGTRARFDWLRHLGPEGERVCPRRLPPEIIQEGLPATNIFPGKFLN